MTIIITASLGGILMASSLEQTDHQIVHSCQDTPRCTDRHTSRIFAESNVTAIVQASFDRPMFASGLKHFCRGSLVSRQAGYAELDFTTGFVDFSLAQPGEILPDLLGGYLSHIFVPLVCGPFFQEPFVRVDRAGSEPLRPLLVDEAYDGIIQTDFSA